MKHAYLIIAHNEPLILAKLVACLDDARNDIFIHWDKKSKEHPSIHTIYSRLIWTQQRVDVRWGDVSQIESELVLFEEASRYACYDYYHLISGTHLPLKTQDEIHQFFEENKGCQIMQRMDCCEFQIDQKMRKYNLFTKKLQYGPLHYRLFFQRMWRLCYVVQKAMGISRHCNVEYKKASNWVSLTNDAVHYLLTQKMNVLHHYKYSFCGDEFFVPTVLEQSYLKNTIFYYDKMLLCDMGNANPRIYEMKDSENIINSGCLFARKFSEKYLDVVNRIVEFIK